MTAIEYNKANRVNFTALSKLGWLPFVLDPETEAGVTEIKAWQVAVGLTPDGKCGPSCWAKLRRLYAPASWLRRLPHGYEEIRAVYGDLGEKIVDGKVTVSKEWKDKHLVWVGLPFDNGKTIKQRQIVKEIAVELATLMGLAVKHGYSPKSVQTWVPRYKRGPNSGSGLSTHCWCAVDFDPNLNPWGNLKTSPIVLHPLFVAFFRVAGWSCGTDWKTPDTMHVQACTGA